IVFWAWGQRIEILVRRAVLEPLLEMWRRVADERVELLERFVLHVALAELGFPVAGLTEELPIGRDAAGEREPLGQIAWENTVKRREINAGMRRGGRDDGGQVRRKLLERGPLVEPSIGAAPHANLAVAPRLLGEPLHHVVSISGVMGKRLEMPTGVAAAAHVHQGEDVTIA